MASLDSWDVFYRRDDAAAVWFAFHLARSLGERLQRARLFCHDVQALSVAQIDLDPSLLIQSASGIEVFDYRLARTVSASPNLIEVFGACPPAQYMARHYTQRAGGTCYSLRAPWASGAPEVAVQLRASSHTHRHFDLWLGDNSNRAGLIRSTSLSGKVSSLLPRTEARASLLNLLGHSQEMLEGKRMVFASARAGVAWSDLLRLFMESEQQTCLFVDHGPAQATIGPVFSRIAGTAGASSAGNLTVVFLPQLLWASLDEVIDSSDFVLTDAYDIAFRAADRGTPVVLAEAHSEDESVGNWLMADADMGLVRPYRNIATSLVDGTNIGEAMDAYLAQFDRQYENAQRIQRRLARAPDLASLLMVSSDFTARTNLETLFAPTQPAPIN
jgi:hypothetical protein